MLPARVRCFRPCTRLFACAFVVCVGVATPRSARAQEALPPPGRPGPAPATRPTRGPAPVSAQLDVAARLSLGAPPAAPAAIDGGTAYVPLRTGQLVAVDLTRALVRWKVDAAVTSAPAAGDGLVFLPHADGLSALAAADGSSRWHVAIEGGLSAPPLWRAGWLIAAAKNGDVMCLRAADGQRVWGAHVTSPVRARPSLTADRVYLSLEDAR